MPDQLTLKRLENESKLIDLLAEIANQLAVRISKDPELRAVAEYSTALAQEVLAELGTDVALAIDEARQPAEPPPMLEAMRGSLSQIEDATRAFAELHTLLQDPIPAAQQLWQQHRIHLLHGIGETLAAVEGLRLSVGELLEVLEGTGPAIARPQPSERRERA